MEDKVASWVEQVSHLADIATTQPHAAYAGFVFGLQHRWTFIQRTIATAGDHMQPLKDAIDHKLLPTLVKHELSDVELELMRLPARFRGMSFDDPVADSRRKHDDSIKSTTNLTQQILENGADLMKSIELDHERKAAVRQHHEASLKVKADDLQKRFFINRMRLGRLRPVTQYCVFKKRIVSAWISFACLVCLGDWHRTESRTMVW